MKPLDPRLLKYARSVRGVLALGGLLGVLRTAAIIAWCWCVSQALMVTIAPVLEGEHWGRVMEGVADRQLLPWLLGGAAVALLLRTGATWAMDVVSARGAVAAKHEIREAALNALDRARAEDVAGSSETATATTIGRGLDALDGYFAAYLPQLILTAVATPFLVLAVFAADWVSALVVVVVFPVIPVFMTLIGLATSAVQKKQWDQLQRLSAAFLDVVSGLTTLKIFRREHHQSKRIARESQEYRKRTMKLLGVTFMSGFVLDLAGTFSVALVAVTVGTRLIDGGFPLALGLFVLLVLPEVFVPIRQVGVAFHMSTEGLEAAQAAFDLIEHTPDSDAAEPRSTRGLRVEELVVTRGDTVIGPHSFAVTPGEVVLLEGPSGAGKSSLLAAIMGFTDATSGRISRGKTAWVGQRPGLLQGTVGDNIALGDTLDRTAAARTLAEVGLEELRLDAKLGALGAGLSGGQAQRVAVARALYRTQRHACDTLILDEPTSALDRDNEDRLLEVIRAVADRGTAVLIVSHRPAVRAIADRIHTLAAPSLPTPAEGSHCART